MDDDKTDVQLMPAMITAPNASVPVGAFRKKPACDSAGATGQAAGAFLVAPDGSVLILRRSSAEKNYAGHWGLPGGGVDDGETPEQGLDRELTEEIGGVPEGGKPKLLDQRRTPNDMVFHTFVKPVKEKFAPKLNDEHTGYDWTQLNQLPQPMHPAVIATIKERIGLGEDMSPEDWSGLRDGFLKWIAEEEVEPAHATDSAMALDRAPENRTKDADGRMHVLKSNISKANICPYRGAEIPGWQSLGLDPNFVYQLYRAPDELKKAAKTFNGLQILRKHIPVNAEDHQPWDTIGATGTDADFDGEYLTNSLHFWSARDIEDIESGAKRELSCGYKYVPVMTAGEIDGKRFDGIMTKIVGNHVTIVEDGRAGDDVVVGDSMGNLKMSKPTRLAVHSLATVAAAVGPMLAMDKKLTISTALFKDVNAKNFKAEAPKILEGVKKALAGNLHQGIAMDAAAENVKTVLDALEGVTENMDGEAEPAEMEKVASVAGPTPPEPQGNKGFDSAPVMELLKSKGLDEATCKQVYDMLPKNMMAGDADETPEEKAVREAKEKEKMGKDNDMVSKTAMDQALKAASTEFDKKLAAVRANEQGIRVALEEVRPYVGQLAPSMAFDSGADVFRHALTMLGVDGAKTVHADALLPILKTQKTIADKVRPVGGGTHEPVLAMDGAIRKEAVEMAPGLENISLV